MPQNNLSSPVVHCYPLVPMQHGMLYNTLSRPGQGVDLTHITYDLPEEINPELLKQAWQQCIYRHAIFRTSFHWEGVDQPVQRVHNSAELALYYEDWTSLAPQEQAEKYRVFLREDRHLDFDFTRPGLLRCYLLKLKPQHYRFIWSYHHSIIDGRASSLVIHEAFSRYDALVKGEPFTEKEIVPYEQYVNWLFEQDWSEAKAFWRERLAGFEQTTPMPSTGAEPDVQVGDHAFEQKLYLSPETTSRLHTLTQKYNITFNTMVQGAWGLLLHHYNNADDIVFGAIRACRRSAFAGTENIIGQLINSVPIRVKITPDMPVFAWLEDLRQQWYTIRPHEHAPYIHIKEWSDVPKGTPLFESIALYDHANVDSRLKSLGGKFAYRDIDIFFKTDMPISLYVHGGERMLLSIYYERDRYQDATVNRMLQQLEMIFTAFAEDETQAIDRIGIVPAGERNTLLHQWNNTQTPFPDKATLPDLITPFAQTHPNTIAISDGNRQLTYAELEQESNQLAHYLREAGTRPGTPIGLCYQRSTDMIVAILAILKAGNIYVPLDPTLPAERLHFIQTDAQLDFILTDQHHDGLTSTQLINPNYHHLTPDTSHLTHRTPHAYIIYTSGSTGQPKGVLCHHAGVINLLSDFARRSPLRPGQNHSLWTNLTFDVSVYEIFSTLTTGGTLHIVPDHIRADTDDVLTWLNHNQIHTAYLPPFMLTDMADWLEQPANTLPLNRLLVGVEPIQETTLARIANQLPQTKIINGYGPTEATVCITLHEFSPENAQAKPTPIGKPLQNTQIYLLNRHLEPVPIGVAGELYVSGAGVASGYWRRPELTEQVFVPNPFLPGRVMYKTGDMARYQPDGTIDFIGRVDFQVKVRGYRVELSEIETALLQHPSVKQTVITAPQDQHGNHYLVAYAITAPNTPFDESTLRHHLAQKLPAYMVPTTFISLDTFPLTPSDKINRRALPQPTTPHTPHPRSSLSASPKTPTEEIIANTFATVLDVKHVSRTDSFLQLGGHSLLATQLISRLNRALNTNFSLSTIFSHPRVSDLAAHIKNTAHTPHPTPYTLHPTPRTSNLDPHTAPLSFAQQRLWFLQRLEPNNTAYNIPLALQLKGDLDIHILADCLNEIICRHDTLRTIFPTTTGDPYQQIQPYTPQTLPVFDITQSDLDHYLKTEANTPFDLTQTALRLRLLRLAPDHHLLQFTTHHIISDGWSHAVFTRELSALYAAFSQLQPSPLPDLAVQYADFAHSQRQWLQGDVLDNLIDYWRDQLDGAPESLALSTDFTRPGHQTHNGAHQTITLDPTLSQAIRHLCQQQETTLFMGLLAGFKTLLHRLTNQTDILVGAPIANRTHLQTESLIGFFINTLVLRTQLDPTATFTDLLQAIRHTTLQAYVHQDLPFEKLVEVLQPTRDLSQTPFFQVFFNMVNVPTVATDLGDLTMTQLPWQDISAKFDLTLYVTETADTIQLELVYNRDLFTKERMTAFLDQYITLLQQAVVQPTTSLNTYTLTTQPNCLPDPTKPLPAQSHTPAHEWLTHHAQTQPHQIAVTDPTTSLTYAQLDQQSTQLAHHLLDQGLQPGDLVAILADRTVHLPVALLATHKANLAFLILDPAYPPGRLQTYLDQAQPKLLLALSPQPSALSHLLPTIHYPLTANGQQPTANTPPSTLYPLPSTPAYIAFTSGTTGTPQAIVGTHTPLAQFWAWQRDTFELTSNDQFTLLSGLAHDPLLRDLFTPIVAGGTLHIPGRDTLYSSTKLAHWMADKAITITHLTPALSQILTAGNTQLPTLRYAFFGGEALTQSVVQAMKVMAPAGTSINFYGTTETPQAMAYHNTRSGLPKAIAPLGQGREGVQILILTDNNELAGIGELGQIAIRSPYLAQGYLNDPANTQAKFIPNPFIPNPDPDDRLYLTGDYGRYLPDGTVEFSGRGDHQINLHGHRIEPTEITHALTQHPAITQALVTTHLTPDTSHLTPRTSHLTAYLITTTPLTDLTIRTHLQTHLPTYMHPHHFIQLDTFPLTPNGKIDYSALPATNSQPLAASRQPLAASGHEQMLATIWQDLLNLEDIDVTANFFTLGGHSLLGTQLFSRIHQQLGLDLPLHTLFTAPTIRQLAQHITSIPDTPHLTPDTSLTPRTTHHAPRTTPLSFAQQRLWILDQLETDNTGYTIGTALALRGDLNLPALNASLNAIIARHDTLRTTFPVIDEQPQQTVHSFEPIKILVETVADSTDLPALIDTHQRQPFDLATGPLARFKLLQLIPNHHILLINLHHIIADGWSATVLMNELRQAYTYFANPEMPTFGKSFAEGGISPPTLPDLPIQYTDYALWQRDWLDGTRLDHQLDYWREQLSGTLPIIDLPMDAPRPGRQTFNGHKLTTPLTNAPTLRQLSQTHNTTLFMTLLAGFKLLLHRLTGQTDLIIGSPIANRNRPEIENLIGFFANTLVLRSQLAPDQPFSDLLKALRTTTLDAYANQDLPFERLVEELQPERDLSRPPLFQLFFNMINMADYGNFDLPGLQTQPLAGEQTIAKFDLTLYVLDNGQDLTLELVYNCDLFTEERMTAFLDQYLTLLDQIVATPTQPLNQFTLNLATPHLPDPTQPLPAHQHTPAHIKISEIAKLYPDKIAVADPAGTLTYHQLDQQSTHLAHHLIENGLQPSDTIAILAHRSRHLPTALLATHKASAAFALLDPAYPPTRLQTYLDQAQPKVLLTLNNQQSTFNNQLKTINIHHALRTTHPAPDTPHLIPDTSHPAYIAFTSGTTGTPRAIRGTHQPLAHFWHWHSQTFGFTPDDQFSLLSGLAHDPLLRDIFTPLTIGATLHIPDPDHLLTPGYLANWMAEKAITVSHLTPAMSQVITSSQTSLPNLRYAFLGGDKLTRPGLTTLHQTAPNAQPINFYGTTETPQAIAYHRVDFANPNPIVPIGHGIEGVQLLILTDTHQLAGIGERGQIAVRTPYLSAGYTDPALTQTKFIPNPFIPNPDPSDRLYLTGDYGRYLPNGDVELIGRADNQVNIRGYRVELSEIEAVLGQHPAGQKAIIHHTNNQLIAYVICQQNDIPSLQTHLQTHLPTYMHPQAIIPLVAFPLTPNGKIDYQALPAPSYQPPATSHQRPATSGHEQMLVTIWQNLLNRGHIDPAANFFHLGGHSLLATQLLSRIQTLFNRTIPLATFFNNPTITHLAHLIQTSPDLPTSRTSHLTPDTSHLTPDTSHLTPDTSPLSFAQQRLWFLDQFDETPFNIPLTIRLTGELDLNALTASLTHILYRHTTLRTTFTLDGDEPHQQIQSTTPLTITQHDLTHLPKANQLTQAKQLATQASLYKFDLTSDTLLRTHLYQFSDTDNILLLVLHHISADGWSSGILLNELSELYTHYLTHPEVPSLNQEVPPFSKGGTSPPNLLDLPIQYTDYAHWQRQWLQGEVFDHLLDYWRKQLANAPAGLNLPTDHPRPTTPTFDANLHRFTLSQETTHRLKQLSQDTQTTLFMTLLTAYKILLHRHTGQNDILVGTPIANRNHQALENLIGMFVNLLVLRSEIDGHTPVRDLLTQVRQTALDAYTHQDMPFEKLVETLQPQRDLTRSPFFQVMFILQNAPTTTLDLPNLTAQPFALTERQTQYDLTLVMWETDDQLHATFEYKTALFTPETISQLGHRFDRLLQAILADPSQTVAQLPLLTEAEIQHITAQQQGQSLPIAPLAVHQLFEQTAIRTPHTIALEAGDTQLTYAQLNQRANQLAHWLQDQGITTGSLVAISLPRSVDALIALIATLKAGATYLILDPAYPEERRNQMLAIAQPNLILTPDTPHLTPDTPHLTPDTPHLTPDTPAYLLFTSGSTGRPKGVLVPHSALTNHCQAVTHDFKLTSQDRVLQFASLSFDVSAEEIFPTWSAGATLVLRPDELPLDFSEYVIEQNLTVVNLPAGYWHDWVTQSQHIPHCLRLVITGSEKVLPSRLAQWHKIAPTHIRWLNAYGPTETTITATLYEPDGQPLTTTAVPIGQPIANCSVHILDLHLNLLPDGVTGELYIGGAGLALGYLHDQAKTDQAFITHPQTGQRLYKTGDLVRRLPDGNLAFLGRADNQVKVRGFRIELGDIESALRQHPSLQNTLVLAQEHPDQPTQLHAYCLTEDDTLTPAHLRAFLQNHLPTYMTPTHFYLLPQFPLLPNGKINQRALLSASRQPPATNGQPPATSNQRPATKTEHDIAAIWADVLKLPSIGLYDNFFDLGGHSLLATQIVSRIRQTLSVELPIRALFESPTVAGLATALPPAGFTTEFDETDEALLADLLDEYEDLDFDDLF